MWGVMCPGSWASCPADNLRHILLGEVMVGPGMLSEMERCGSPQLLRYTDLDTSELRVSPARAQ